jgi:hypothetical protein
MTLKAMHCAVCEYTLGHHKQFWMLEINPDFVRKHPRLKHIDGDYAIVCSNCIDLFNSPDNPEWQD